MKLSQEELDRLEQVCKGLPQEEVKNIVSTYYKEKLARLNPKINKSYSYKQENKLSVHKSMQSLISNIIKGGQGE